ADQLFPENDLVGHLLQNEVLVVLSNRLLLRLRPDLTLSVLEGEVHLLALVDPERFVVVGFDDFTVALRPDPCDLAADDSVLVHIPGEGQGSGTASGAARPLPVLSRIAVAAEAQLVSVPRLRFAPAFIDPEGKTLLAVRIVPAALPGSRLHR